MLLGPSLSEWFPPMSNLAAGLSIVVFCLALRPFATTDPVVHILLQLPLLAVAGFLICPARATTPSDAIALVIVAGSAVAFWMLPRSIDLALAVWWVDAAKFVTLFLLVGSALRLAWPNLPCLLRPFLKAQVLSMLGVLGFIYIHAPIRICNAYLESDQQRLGYGFLILSGFLTLYWVLPVFTGSAFRFSGAKRDRVSI